MLVGVLRLPANKLVPEGCFWLGELASDVVAAVANAATLYPFRPIFDPSQPLNSVFAGAPFAVGFVSADAIPADGEAISVLFYRLLPFGAVDAEFNLS